MHNAFTTSASGTQDRPSRPGSSMHQNPLPGTEDITRYFQEKLPVMLDGALAKTGDQNILLKHARESLTKRRGQTGLMPAAILRETLDAVHNRETDTGRTSPAKAGLTAIGPNNGRVWWDETVLDSLEDVIARLDQPRLVLRFYDITGLDPESGRWHDSFDVDVEIEQHGKTVTFWSSGRAYIVDLGFVHADGRFLRLARTNYIHLPRDGKGDAPDGVTAHSLVKPRSRNLDPRIAPDADAREWAAARPDSEQRDIEAELIVHMLYRSFLKEGPRALRRAPRLVRRDPEILRREFHQRERARDRQTSRNQPQPGQRPAVLVARLDAEPQRNARVQAQRTLHLPATACRSLFALAVERVPLARAEHIWFQDLLHAARTVPASRFLLDEAAAELPADQETVVQVETENVDADETLVQTVAGSDHTLSFMTRSNSVFEAAKNLRESLTEFRALGQRMDNTVPHEDADDSVTAAESPAKDEPLKIFGGAEAKRMAKAGVRITRMALTLEGRMRPGARLKVAGKLVHADADGRFRLECVLSGRRASIPMRAGASIGGEARSLINVEWEKRASREKKKVW